MATPDPKSLFTFRNGDMQILVTYNNQQVIGRVSSDALCRASKVFEKFIHPPFGVVGTGRLVARDDEPTAPDTSEDGNSETTLATLEKSPASSPKLSSASGSQLNTEPLENNPTTSPEHIPVSDYKVLIPELDLQEWDGAALLVILSIAHLEFLGIPKKMSSQELHEIAKILDFADCVELVKPWLDGWLSGFLVQDDHMFLVSWVFGMEKLLEALAANSVLKGPFVLQLYWPKGAKEIAGSEVVAAYDCQMPPELAESIYNFRLQAIRTILDIAYKEANAYMDPRGSPPRCFRGMSHCDALTCGSLILGLVKLYLWPPRKPEAIALSVSDLAKQLMDMEIFSLSVKSSNAFPADSNHKFCPQIKIKEKIEGVLKKLPSPVLESHKLHMARQHERLYPKV